MKPKKKNLFEDTLKRIEQDEKSVDVIMRDELHQECLIDRCLDSPK